MGRLLAPVLAGLILLCCAAPASADTTWLCRPGMSGDACAGSLKTTRFAPDGERLGTTTPKRDARRVDCFYVYPTVSNQTSPVATRKVDPELRSIALFQAARFSRHCRIFAPVYRQRTLNGLATGTNLDEGVGYDDVRDAWRTYLKRYNRGRGVVLLGHSQGTFVLRRLAREEIDRSAAARKRLVSALLIGGNVLVRRGSDTGGDFRHIRACRRTTQTGCVVAYSVFDETPPAESVFGRTTEKNREVLCTNPASLRGGSGSLTAAYPSKPFAPGGIATATASVGFVVPRASTPWLSIGGAYTARCSKAGGASVLRVRPRGGAPDLNPSPAASWGLHLADMNLALDSLVDLVGRQAKAYAARR